MSACPDTHAETPGWLQPLLDAVHELPDQLEQPWLRPPADGSGRTAAVLIALRDAEAGPAVVLLQRASGMRNHAGQVAFPGGAADAGDADITATALREATEEVGLDPSSVEIVGHLLPRFLPPSGFVITPVLAWWRDPHPVAALDQREVAGVAVVPLAELADPANRYQVSLPKNRFRAALDPPSGGFNGPAFDAGGLFIWGFTAGLLDDLLRLGGWEKPWNTSDIRPLPVEAGRPRSPRSPRSTPDAP